jgi:hypothetical protein
VITEEDKEENTGEVIQALQSWWTLAAFKNYNDKIFINYYNIIFFIASGVGLSPLYCGHFWPIVPAPDDR